MSNRVIRSVVSILVVFVLVVSVLSPLLHVEANSDALSKIHPLLLKKILQSSGEEIVEIVVRLTPLPREIAQQVKGNYRLAVNALKNWAEATQIPIVKWIEQHGGVVLNRFWLDNIILAKLPAKLVVKLAEQPSVVKIFENFEVKLIEPVTRKPADVRADQVSSWGIFKIRANETWALGITGEGIRIAVLDTGVDITHPALAGKMLSVIPGDPYYPGGWMEFDSAGNPIRSTPHDTHGHGTHCSGTALGGNTVDILIGVAPGATLMHGLVLPGGGGTFAQVLAGMQWTVDPYYLTPGGDRVYTGLPAQVVSMSWGANEFYGNELLPAIEAMLLANIVPVAAIGNAGPGTTSNPGNIWGTFGIGATDINDNVASWSSGKVVTWPSPPPTWPFFDIYPSTYIKPDLSAPGVAIRSSVPGGGYEDWSGTSMATPHVAGTVALMLQAAMWFNYDVPDIPEKIYLALNSTAIDFGDPGQDIRYGWGRIDAYEAVRKAMEYAKKSGVEGFVLDEITSEPVPWATVTVVEIDQTFKVNATGGFKIPLDPGNYTLVFSAWGYENVTITVEVVLLNGTITGLVYDALTGDPIVGANVTVIELNITVQTDENGVYEVSVPPGTYNLLAEASGYQPGTATVTVDEAELVVVDFALYPLGNGTIAGHVYDVSTGDPIEDAVVWTYVNGELVYNFTDATGYYELSVPSGTYDVYAWKPGYQQGVVQNVTVAPLETVIVDFYLEPLPPTVVVLANVDYLTAPHLKTIVEALGLPVVEYDSMITLLEDWVNGLINPKVIIVDHTMPTYYDYPPEDVVLAFHMVADYFGSSIIWLCTSYSGFPGIYVLYIYNTTLVENGYPAPNSRLYGYPSPTYVQVEMLNMTHPIFDDVTPDVPDYPNRFYLGTGSYVDYAIYNFTDPTGRFNVLGYVWDTRYANRFGVGVAEWLSNTNMPWYYLGSWAESYYMQYLEPGADGMYTNNTKKVLENAVLLAWNATIGQLTINREMLGKALIYALRALKPVTITDRDEFKTYLYTQVTVYMPRLPHGYVTGRVLGSDGAVLAGAKVEVVDTPVTVTTNATGYFYTWLPEGTYTLRISYPGYKTKEVTVEVSVNETVDLGDIILARVPRVGIMWDYAGALKSFFESKGWYAISYTNLTQLTNDILAGLIDTVIYSGDYGVPFPTATEFYAFLNATFEKGVGVIWMDSYGYYGYGIKVLYYYLNDPPTIGYSWGYPVYIKVTKSHPILRGYNVGDLVLIVTYSYADFSWFSGFSGEAIADTVAGGVTRGNAIAWKVFDNGVKWALLSSFAPTSWNTPGYFTTDAWNIIYNAAIWVASKPLNVTLENPYLHVGDIGVLYITGGPAYTTIYIYLDGELFDTVETDEYGSATLIFTVPLIPGGEHVIEASTEDMLYYGYTSLYVLPKTTITPETIVTPATVCVEATGLQPRQLLYIYLDGNYLSMYRANTSGAFTVKLNIPLVEAGEHEVVLVDANTGDVIASVPILISSKLDDAISKLDQLLLSADQLSVRIEEIRGDIVIIKSILGSVVFTLDELLARISALNATIVEIRGDTVFIKTKIGDLEVSLDTIISKLNLMNATIVEIKSGVATIVSDVGVIHAKLDAISPIIVEIRSGVATILTEIGELKASLSTIRNLVESSCEAIITKIESGVATITTESSVIRADLTAINATIVAIKDDVTVIRTDIGDVKADLATLKPQVTSISDDVVTIKTELGVINGKVEAISETLLTIKTDIGTINVALSDIKTSLDAIKTTISTIETDVSTIKSDVKTLKADAETIKTDASTIKSNVEPIITISIGVWLAAIFSIIATALSAVGIRKK